MKETVIDILQRLLSGSRLSSEELLWGTLIAAFLLSTLHLITMFVTRWGDDRVTGKALLFSLMLHFAFLVSVVTVVPPPSIPAGGDEPGAEDEHKVVIRSIPVDGVRQAADDPSGTGRVAAWDRLPAAKNLTAKGPVAQSAPTTPSPNVARVETQTKPPPMKSPDLATLPEKPETPQQPIDTAAAGRKQAALTPAIETPATAAAPPKTTAAAPPPLARTTTPSAAPVEEVERRKAPQNTVTPPPRVELPSSPSLLPLSEMPKAGVVDASPSAAPRLGPSPAKTIVSAPEIPARPAKTSASATILPLVRERAPAVLPEAQVAVINRLPSNRMSTSPSQKPVPGATGDYQPLDTRPDVPSPPVSPANEPLIVGRSVGVPSTYRLRKLSNRKQNARRFGGTDQSEQAVEASLRWLAQVQTRAGSWDADAFGAGQVKIDENGVDRDFAGRDADSGVTALAVLAFLAAGYTHEEGRYADNVDRALRWLISEQQPDGNLGSRAGHFAMMYCHGMATYAIAEAYGMQNDPTSNTMLREPLVSGIRFILDHQSPTDGGWRYLKGQKSDMSITGWQLMALKSAEIAGVSMPRDAKVKMVSFLRERSLGTKGGLAGYREDMPASPAMTAESLFCKQMMGMKRDNASAREAADYVLARLPRQASINEYYWYYGTLAMYQQGGKDWQTWNSALRDLLISQQQTAGQFPGSWDPVGPWAKYGGRVYSTALCTLCLEVYYRFLPLYRIGGETE